MKGILLFIVSVIMGGLKAILLLLCTIIAFKRGKYNEYFMNLAISNDQHGNVVGQYVFNLVLIKSNAIHKFGNPDETISSVLGKNKKDNTLTRLGSFIANILDRLEPNHVEKAIDLTEN